MFANPPSIQSGEPRDEFVAYRRWCNVVDILILSLVFMLLFTSYIPTSFLDLMYLDRCSSKIFKKLTPIVYSQNVAH